MRLGAALVAGLLLAGGRALAQEGMLIDPPPPPEAAPPAPWSYEVLPPGPWADEPAPAGETPTVPPPSDRITFELPLESERGGGNVAGAADRLETTGETEAVLEGDVEIRYRDIQFRAQRVVLHRDTMTLEAEGDVVFDQGPRRIAAARLDFDLATRTGTFWNASAAAEPDLYFTGAVVAKTGESTYEIQDGVFTACTGDRTPDWSLRTSSADIELGGYAHIRNARMRMKKMPLLYWPYVIWPAKTERTSGLLIPNFGYSQRRGTYLGLAYYQVMGPSADGTLFLDGFSEGFAGAGAEVRYRPREGTKGQGTFYVLRDADAEVDEWRARFNHSTSDLPWRMRGVVNYEDYSDYDFFRQFERAERDNTRRFLYSSGFLSGTWGAQSLNLLVDQRETFLGRDLEGKQLTTEQRQLPELAYRLTKLKLGDSRLYLSLDSTASYLETSSSGFEGTRYGRFDLAPELTYPLRPASWLSVALSAGGRATWWGETVAERRTDPVTQITTAFCGDREVPLESPYCGESLDRVYPTASLELIGPSFSRIFDAQVGRFGKFKHLIEPRWSYGFLGDFDEQERVPRFDEIDPFEGNNVGQFALVNRVLAKPSDPEQGGAFEVLAFELAQAFSFDDAKPLQRSRDGSRTSQESGVVARLRYNPSRALTVQSKAVWSTLFGGLASTSISARGTFDRVDLDLTWFTDYDAEAGEKSSDQARLGMRLDLLPSRLRLSGLTSYNLETARVQQQRYFLTWTSQCWSVQLEAREQVTASYTSRDYRFLLNLKNVGTFLDLSSGDSSGYE